MDAPLLYISICVLTCHFHEDLCIHIIAVLAHERIQLNMLTSQPQGLTQGRSEMRL